MHEFQTQLVYQPTAVATGAPEAQLLAEAPGLPRYNPEHVVVSEPHMLKGNKKNVKKEPGKNYNKGKRPKTTPSNPDSRPKHTKWFPTSYPKDQAPKP